MSRRLKLGLTVMVVLAAVWHAARDPSAMLLVRSGRAAEAQAAPTGQVFTARANGTMMRVAGRVQRVLADDRDGSPHQRFIIVTDSGTSLLIAHNIDLAPRLQGLATGDIVAVYGEYQWNQKGGLIHWTHKDPAGKHPSGYIEWRGRRYQ